MIKYILMSDIVEALIDEIKKLENGWKYIDKVDLPPDVYFYVKVYGLTKHGLKRHQIREYFLRLAQEDKKKYELENNKRIEYDITTKSIKEKNGRQ